MRHFPLAPELSIFSETLGKRVVVDFQLCDFVILVGCDPKEGGLWEWEDVVSAGELEAVEVVGSHNVNPGHILVHRCQNDLEKEKINSQLWYDFFHPNNFRETLMYTRIFRLFTHARAITQKIYGIFFSISIYREVLIFVGICSSTSSIRKRYKSVGRGITFLLSHSSKFVALIRIFFIPKPRQSLLSVWSL